MIAAPVRGVLHVGVRKFFTAFSIRSQLISIAVRILGGITTGASSGRHDAFDKAMRDKLAPQELLTTSSNLTLKATGPASSAR